MLWLIKIMFIFCILLLIFFGYKIYNILTAPTDPCLFKSGHITCAERDRLNPPIIRESVYGDPSL